MTLYLGLTKVIKLLVNPRGEFWLEGQTGTKSFSECDHLFDPDWERPQVLTDLDRSSKRDRASYIRAVTDVALRGKRFVSREGALQASLVRWPERFALIDRESVVGFRHGAQARFMGDALSPVQRAIDLLRADGIEFALDRSVTDEQRHVVGAKPRGKSFGNELDGLAIDNRGRILVIEAKDSAEWRGCAWTPAQAAVYLRLMKAWGESDPAEAAEVLNGMRAQRQTVGLLDDGPQVALPLRFVPVIVVGVGNVAQAAETNERMVALRSALSKSGEPLQDLEVWQVDGSHDLKTLGLGRLE